MFEKSYSTSTFKISWKLIQKFSRYFMRSDDHRGAGMRNFLETDTRNRLVSYLVRVKLTHGAESYRNEYSLINSRNSPPFLELEVTSPCSQELTPGSFRQPDESNPHVHILFLEHHFAICCKNLQVLQNTVKSLDLKLGESRNAVLKS
jgi:hypothetical protein